jgi:hypothetical protein
MRLINCSTDIHNPALRGAEFNGFAGKDCELFWSTGGHRNSKSQIRNIKQITMTKIRNSKPVSCFGH